MSGWRMADMVDVATRGGLSRKTKWVWVKTKPPGIGPQILVHASSYEGNPFWVSIFDPQPNGKGCAGGACKGASAAGSSAAVGVAAHACTRLW